MDTAKSVGIFYPAIAIPSSAELSVHDQGAGIFIPSPDSPSHYVKFYQEDLVQRVDDLTSYGVVLRCWHDPEDIPPSVSLDDDPLLRALQPGEIGVSFFPSGRREILPESQFTLVDRTFQRGDICKRNINDVRSGIIIRTDVKARLQHAISGECIEGLKDSKEVNPALDVEMGDYVIYEDWVGQVIEMFDEALIELDGGQIVRMPEMSARLSVGDRGSDILPSPTSGMANLFGSFGESSSNSHTVVSITHTVLAISWLAVNQILDPKETQSKQRPRRIWHGDALSKLTLARNRPDFLRVGEKVLFKNEENVPFTRHGTEDIVLEVRHFVVKETTTAVTVLWQDNVQETLPSTQLVPYLHPDEYDCWPGNAVNWKSGGTTRPAIVQSVNAAERTAYIRYMDIRPDNVISELVSLLELDPHGNHNVPSDSTTDDLGVHRGDWVFLHRPGTVNGVPKLRIPRIGELESWVRESPTFRLNGQPAGWRSEMSDIGASIASSCSKQEVRAVSVRRPAPGDTTFNWFGEVTNLLLDGSVEVTLPDSSVLILPLERLTRLYDGFEQLGHLQDLWDDEFFGDLADIGEQEATDIEVQWHTGHPTGFHDWESEGSNSSIDVDEVPSTWDDESSASTSLPAAVGELIPDSPSKTPLSLFSSPHDPEASIDPIKLVDNAGVDSSNWQRFEILPSAPPDHAFYSTVPTKPPRSFLTRLNKEYRALSNSLPDSIIVRTFEDRADLLRSLIIGPEGTPYEDGPFVIDWRLDSDYPHTPPIAHFLSWTNGNGRVNPNLYEEGKVCLSILGTWAGDQHETWSASRSSLLQAFVSIQGLVLVKEPYFCEPAYEKFRNTEEGTINSRLYNEKAYVLSREFILRALELRLGGLESELEWMYLSNGRLNKALSDSEALIERSKLDIEEDRNLAVSKLTAGGVILLQRTITKLKLLLTNYSVHT